MMRLTVPLIAAMLTGCGALVAFVTQFHPSVRYNMPHEYQDAKFTAYPVKVNARTETGITVDTSGFPVDLARIDFLVGEVAECLQMSLVREGITVKIAPDWYVDACTGRQEFPCDLPQFRREPERCEACPCGCSGILQPPATIVTTPDLRTLKHECIHLVTGAVWCGSSPVPAGSRVDPRFRRCE